MTINQSPYPIELAAAVHINRPIMSQTERDRSAATYTEWTMTEEERLAYIAKHGAPLRPLKKPFPKRRANGWV